VLIQRFGLVARGSHHGPFGINFRGPLASYAADGAGCHVDSQRRPVLRRGDEGQAAPMKLNFTGGREVTRAMTEPGRAPGTMLTP
jgi:hypothetical protein